MAIQGPAACWPVKQCRHHRGLVVWLTAERACSTACLQLPHLLRSIRIPPLLLAWQVAHAKVAHRCTCACSAAHRHLLQANLVWSFATLESEPRPELMAILAAALVQRISDCNPQELSNTIWAFAKLRAAHCFAARG